MHPRTTTIDFGPELPDDARSDHLAPHEMLWMAADDALGSLVLAARAARTAAYSTVLAARRLRPGG